MNNNLFVTEYLNLITQNFFVLERMSQNIIVFTESEERCLKLAREFIDLKLSQEKLEAVS